MGEEGSLLPVSGGKRHGSATEVTVHLPRSGSVKVRPMRSVPSGVGLGRCGEDGDDVGRGVGSSNVNKGVGKWSRVSVVRVAAVDVTHTVWQR